MGLIEDVFKELQTKGVSIDEEPLSALGQVAEDYLAHRIVKEREDLQRRSCGDRINKILRVKGLMNYVIHYKDKYYKCIRVDMPSRQEFDIPDSILQKYIPKEVLNQYTRTTRSYSYGYAQDVTEEMLQEEAERQVSVSNKEKLDLELLDLEMELEGHE